MRDMRLTAPDQINEFRKPPKHPSSLRALEVLVEGQAKSFSEFFLAAPHGKVYGRILLFKCCDQKDDFEVNLSFSRHHHLCMMKELAQLLTNIYGWFEKFFQSKIINSMQSVHHVLLS